MFGSSVAIISVLYTIWIIFFFVWDASVLSTASIKNSARSRKNNLYVFASYRLRFCLLKPSNWHHFWAGSAIFSKKPCSFNVFVDFKRCLKGQSRTYRFPFCYSKMNFLVEERVTDDGYCLSPTFESCQTRSNWWCWSVSGPPLGSWTTQL